jgi:phosphate:Na+ symporter
MITFGFALKMFAKNDKYREIGNIILGFGILFFGMKLMSDSMSPLRTLPGFIDMIKGLENPFLGIIVGSLFTALIQSSSAFTGIVIVLAQQGFITLEAGIPLILGANIGTCITAALASIGTSREAKRVAIAHVLFQVVGVLLFIWWIPSFANLITEVSGFFGSSQMARQIANAHTIFNVSVGIAILPFTGLLASIIMKILPAKFEKKPWDLELKVFHLDDSMIETPSLAIDLVRTEIARMAKLLNRMLNAIIIPFISDPDLIRTNPNIPKDEKSRLIREIPSHDMIFKHLTLQEGIDLRERKIDFLDEKIHEYLMKIARQELNEDEAEEVFKMTSVTNDMESIGDIIHRNMLPLLKKKKALKVEFSTEGKEDLMRYHRKVIKQLRRLQNTFEEKDKDIANTIMVKEDEYTQLETQFRLKHMNRVIQKKGKSLKTHETHLEFMDLLKQINVYTINIAKSLVT